MNDKKCASPNTIHCWEDIDFPKAKKSVKKLQKRIVLACIDGHYDKALFLQHKMIHSFYAKALAVKIVTSNKGKRTAGIDGTLWVTPEEKYQAIFLLNRKGYKSMPLKRIYVRSSNGKVRPLGIPTIKDRAMQTLYRLALEPIAEILSDECSYGFRPNRGARDAIIQCGRILLRNPDFKWVLKTDVKSCFDNISHEWILDRVPIDKVVLKKFIKCGYIDKSVFHVTDKGVPQGGCISGVICNLTLNGLEGLIEREFENSVCLVRYADDIAIFADSPKLLVHSVVPLIEQFLEERGLKLSVKKTSVFRIDKGVPFLGWNLRYDGELINFTPTRANINSMKERIISFYRNSSESPIDEIGRKIQAFIRGWLNYYKWIASEQALCDVILEVVAAINNIDGDKRIAEYIINLLKGVIDVRTYAYHVPNSIELIGCAKNDIVEALHDSEELPDEHKEKLHLAYKLLDQVQTYLFEA